MMLISEIQQSCWFVKLVFGIFVLSSERHSLTDIWKKSYSLNNSDNFDLGNRKQEVATSVPACCYILTSVLTVPQEIIVYFNSTI